MVEKMGEDDKKEEEEKKRAGCTSVGPGTLGEASAQVGASAIESLLEGPNMPMGVPMIPGVTKSNTTTRDSNMDRKNGCTRLRASSACGM
jgi:hypothetical protein